MPGKKNKFYRASLLDRLLDNQPWAKSEYMTLSGYSLSDYKESIRRDLTLLLNTRSPSRAENFDRDKLTVMDYGIPDFANYSLEYSDDCMLIARRLTHAIKCFEPRLKNPAVLIEPEMQDEKSMIVRISAELLLYEEAVHISFLTKTQTETGQWEVYEKLRY
jgi:type VI secretion system protein ImpF